MARRAERELIIRILYVMDLVKTPLVEALEDLEETPSEFVVETLTEIEKNIEKIDALIEENLIDWKLSRLSFLDRAIIRLATYEMMYSETPKEIVIDEAVELTKRYTDVGDGKSKAFNNRVLDNIKKHINA